MTVNRGDRVGVADPGFAVIGGEPSPAEWIIRAARDPPDDSPGDPRQELVWLRPEKRKECLDELLSSVERGVGLHRNQLGDIFLTMPGRLQYQIAPWPEHAIDLGEGQLNVGDVLQGVEAEYALDAAIRERQAAHRRKCVSLTRNRWQTAS